MDFHSLKRKELQALCKKHGIPANLTNREMADRLASNFKENKDPVLSEKSSTSPVEICCENDAKVVKKQSKKVRFSPESDNQTFEYEVSVYQKPKRAMRQTLSKNPVQNAVKEDTNEVSSPPVGRKRRRGGKKSKDDDEVDDIEDSESIELGMKDVKNDTGELCGRQLRSRKNVTQVDAKKLRNGKGGDEVHLLLDESSEAKNGPKQQSNVGVVSRITRQSRALSKDVVSMVTNEVKIVEVKEGCEAEKPQRRSKRNSEKDCAKSATSAKSENEVIKVQEQSERDIALVEPPECSRRYPSRRKSVVSQRSTVENKELLKEESNKRSRTTELDAIVEDSSEVERVKYNVTSQHNAPSRRDRRKTVILTAPASELANEEDIAVTSQHQAPLRRGRRTTLILTAPASELENQEDVGKGTTEKQRKSSRNSSRYSSPGTSKEDPKAVSKNDQRVEHRTQEPIVEEEKTSAREHHPPTQKLQRRSRRNTCISATVGPPSPTAKGVKKEQKSKSTMAIVEEEAAPTDSLPSPGELPTGKDVLVAVSERAGNEYNLDVDVSKQVAKNGDTCSNKSRKGLRKNSEAEKKRGFAEASPLFLKMEECKDPSRNVEENLIASCVKLVGPSTDLEVKQYGHGSVSVYEKESNFVEDAIEKFVPDGNIESEVTCMSSQTITTTGVLDVANFSDPKRLKFESYSNHGEDSSRTTFPYGSHGKGVLDQEMKEEMKLTDKLSAHESLIAYKEDTTLVESEKEMVVQVDAAGSEMNHHSSWSLQQRASVSDSNRVKSRQVELENNVINMVEITCPADGLSDQRDLTGATSTFLQSEEESGTELAGGENTNFTSDNVTAADRTPFAEAQIGVELNDTEVTAAESDKEEVLNMNKFGEIIGFKIELENPLKKAEEIIATGSSKEGIPQMQSSVEASENQESSAKSHFATVDIDTQKIYVNQQSSYSNTVAPGTPCEPVPGNQFQDKCRAEAANTTGRKIFDQKRRENPNPGNAPCIHESVSMYEESPCLVKNDEEIRKHDEHSESESSLSLRTGAVENFNLVESRLIDFGSSSSKVVSPVVFSLANIFSSADQGEHPGKSSSPMEPNKVLETQEASENIKAISCNMDAEGIRNSVPEDQERSEDPGPGSVPCFNESNLNRTGVVDDSNLVESRMDDSRSSCTKVVSPETVSLADICSSASQGDDAGKSSSRMQLEKVLQEPSENMKSISYDMDAAGIRTPVPEDQQRGQDQNPGNVPCIHESVLKYGELVKNNEDIKIHDDCFESESSPSLNRTGAVDDSNLGESTMVDFGSSSSKVVFPEIVSLVDDIFSSSSQGDHAGKTSKRMELEKVLETEAPYEIMESISYNMDAEGIRTPVPEDQIKGKLENANVIIAESVEEVIFNDLLNEFGESIGLKRGSEIPFKTSEKLTATEFSDGEGIMLAESSVKAEKQEYRTEIGFAVISGTPNTTEKKCISSSDIATRGTPVGLVAQSQDKQCSAGIAVSIAESERCNQDMGISLVDDEKEKLHQDDTIKGEMKNQPFLSLNKTSSSGMTYLADDYSSTNQTNFIGETSNELKPEKLSDLEESSWTENVNYRSDKIEVKEDKSLPQEDLSSMHLEDTNMTAAEPVQEIVFLYPLEVCESGDTKESEISLRKEETGSDGSSGIGTVQTESSIETNGMSEVKEDTGLAQEDQSSIHLEDTNVTRSQLDQDVVFSDRLNKVCVSDGTKESEESLKKAELTGTDDSSVKRMVQTESSVGINKMSEASGQKTIMAMEWSEVKEDTGLAQEDQSSIHLEDTNVTRSQLDQDVVSSDRLNKVCVSGGTKESEESMKKAEFTDTDDSSVKRMVRTESSVGINKISEASGQKSIMAMEWSQDFQGTIYRVETDVSNAGYAMPDQLINEEFVKIFENEETINTEMELYVSGKKVIDQSSEGKFVAIGGFDPLSENNSQRAKDKRLDFSDGSVNNVSGETQEKPCEVLDGEGTDPVSLEEKDICNKKLPYSSCLPAINDAKEKSHAVCMDLKNTRIQIPVNILPQHELKQLDIESETQKQGAGSEVNAGTLTQAFPPENLTAPITPESFSMSALDHAAVDGERNASGERVMDRPSFIDFVATMDGNGVIEGGETDGVQEDTIVEEMALALKLELTDCSGSKVDAELYDTDMSDTKTIFQEIDTFAAKQLATAFAIEVGVEDGEKSIDSHQGSLRGDEQEDISSFSDTPCSKLEISIGSSTLLCSSISAKKKEHPQAMHDINHVWGTEISTECKEHKHLDESNFFTKMEMSLFLGDDDEVKETYAKAGDSNDVDKAITECNSREFKEGDYVAITDAEDTSCSVKKDGPEDTMRLREGFLGHNAAMEDKSPLLKSSKTERVVNGEAAPAFRTELNMLNGSAKKETSNSVPVKQLISSIMKSKSNSRLIQRTPKRQIFHDMKENEGGAATKRAQMGKGTTPKTSSKVRRPLDRI